MAQFDLSYVIPIAILAGLGGAAILARDVLRRDTGNDRMREIASAIQLGARAFLRRQYRTIAPIAGGLAIVFAVALGLQGGWQAGLKTAFAFGLGASFSALSGFIGMHIAIRANVRSAAGSLKSFNDALVTALRGGAVSGLSIVAMSLAGISILYYGYGYGVPPTERDQALLILSIVAFGFGASLVALFAQLGGGIYTKAADVGADLVGKVESGIPEDDPRNPAVIADLVGDNVGHAPASGRERGRRVDLASVLALRPRGHDHGVPVRVDYPVLHGGAISTRAGDREILGDGPGDEHHLGLLRRPRGDMASGARRLRRPPDLLLARTVDRDHDHDSGKRRALRNRDCDDGDALNRRLHPGDGHVRPDRGQRRRDRPDVRDVGGRTSEHGQARRRREHH